MRKSNRVLAALLSILMIISMLPVFAGAAAYGFSDFPTGTWSEEAVTAAVNNGLLQGKGGGIIAPRDNLTRAEAAAVINRAFGATVKADISEYTDVNPGDWYYSEFQKAVNMGTIVGEGEGILNPNGYITREAMFTMVARALVLSDTTAGSLSRFVDGSDTSVWAASYVSAMAKRGYVNGDNDGRLNPQAYITREEFAQVMHNIFKMYISTSGTVSDAVYGTTIIRVPNVDLKNITINGDLILGDGVGAGDVYMTNVKVTGRILCRGGEGTVDILSGCSVGEMVVIHDVNGVVNFHNYSNEKIFEGIVLNTDATFLGNVSINKGSSSSSKKKVYTVAFKGTGYDVTKGKKLSSNANLKSAMEAAADKEGYEVTFNTKADGTGTPITVDTVVSGNMEIFAIETPIEYTITYELNGGTLTGAKETYTIEDADYTLPTPDKTGHTFLGWFDNAELTGTAITVIVKGSTGNKTYYAKWEEIIIPEDEYTITYVLNGGLFDVTPKTTYKASDADYELPIPERDGYAFKGWYETEDFSTAAVKILTAGSTGNKTYYAKWVSDEATLRFDYDTVEVNAETVVVRVILTNIPTNVDNLGAIQLEYKLTGNENSVLYAVDSVVSNIGGNLNSNFFGKDGVIAWYVTDEEYALTAEKLEEAGNVLFTITFKRDVTKGGTVNIAFDNVELAGYNLVPVPDELYERENTDITIPNEYTVTFKGTGYGVCNGWKLSSNEKLKSAMEVAADKEGYEVTFNTKADGTGIAVTLDTPVNGDMEIFAIETPIEYTITYVLNGGTLTGAKETYTIEDADYTLPTPDKTGYTFLGWFDNAELTGTAITVIVKGSTGNKTYYAKWRLNDVPPAQYTVTFKGTGYDVTEGQKLSSNEKLKSAMEAAADKEGYEVTFNTKADGTGIAVTLDTPVNGDMEIFAIETPIEYTITYVLNGGTLTGAKETYTIEDADYTLPTPDKTGHTFLGWFDNAELTGTAITVIVKGSTGDKTYYAKWEEIEPENIVVYVYKGRSNEPVGKIDVGTDKTISQDELEAIIPEEEYVIEEGYKYYTYKEDGSKKPQVHQIMPEYWYQDGTEWKLFDVDMEITKDTNVYLMTAYVSLSYETDIEVKGIKIPKFDIYIAYDSNTEIIKSGLDALTAFGEKLESTLYDLEEHGGFDLYEFALEKAAKTGFVDADGNLLNPLIPIPLDKIVTEDLIMKEIDIYIDANIDNEEFIRDILRHDSVEKMLLEDEQLKHNAMGDPEIRSIFLTDDFIKEIIKDDIENNNSAFVNDIINNTDFASTVINNDSVLDYVLNNEEIRAKVLESGTTFKLKIVDTGAQHIENVYFGDTVDAELKSYIETELKSKAVKGELKVIIENSGEIRAVLKTTLETDEDAKAILKTELLKMLQNPQTNSEIKAEVENYLIANKNVVKDEVTSYIKDNKNSTSIKNTVVQYIKDHKNDKLIKDAVVDYITTNKNNTTIKNTIVSYIKDHKNDDLIKGTVKSYLEEHMNDATVRGTVVDYIEKHSEEDTIKDRVIDYIVSNVDDFKADDKRTDILSNQTVRTQFVNAYESVTIGTVWEDVDADTFIDKFINAPSELKAIDESTYNNIVAEYKKAIEDNIEEYATSNYTTLFSDYFNETYLNSKADSESEKTVYEKLFEDNLNAIMNDTATYETLFNANIDKITGDKDKYEELFSNNVTSIVNDKVKDPQTNKTVYETLFDDNVDAIISDDTKDSETGKTPYETLFDDNVDTIINDNTKDSETGKTAYETLFDDNFSTYYNSLGTDEFNNLVNTHFDSFYTSQYDSLFDEYFDDYFDEIFDSLYEANVEKWANIAYDEPTTTATVRSTIKNVVTRLVDEYIAGAKDADDDVEVESGLKSMVDKVIAQVDIKATLRENYNNDGDFKTTVDQLIKDNASMIVSDYAYEKLDDASETTIRDIIHTQVEKLVDDYVNYNMDKDLQEFIDVEINKHMKEYIDGYIAGDSESVEMLEKLVPTYAHTAVEALKKTLEFKNTITDFTSGKGVRVNEGNIVFIEILDELMHTYNYDKLASDFLPENIQKVVDLIGHDIVADIVNAYFAEFCNLMDDAVAEFNTDYDAGNTAAEYTFSTRPAVRINYMDIVETYYNKVMNKVVPKLNSKELIAINPYAQELINKNWILEFLDYDAAKVSEEMSGYSIKKGHYDEEMGYGSPIVRYYDILLENVILVHDAVMWYNKYEASVEDKLDAVSQILGVYANKANDAIMHYIETGELPKGYTPYELADKFLGKVLGVNDKIDGAYDKAENFYEKHEEKITEYIDKAKTFYEDYLDRDYTEIIDLANLSVYADGEGYEIYKILLEISEENNAFNIDTLATAIFDSANYRGVNKIEDVMMKIKSKLEGLRYEPVTSLKFVRNAYKKTVSSREVKGYNTGSHTVDAQRYLQYITD